jgi:hypothetical protein
MFDDIEEGIGQTAIPVEEPVQCERCRERPSVHTHHRNLDRQLNTPENLRRVCLFCHAWIHDKVEEAYATGWLVHSWDDVTQIESIPLERPATGREHDDLAPGETCPTCGRKKPLPRQPARNRTTVSMKVPMDKLENGADLWDELIAIGRGMLCSRLGWEPDVPTYNVAMVLVAQGLEAVRGESFNPVPGHRLTEALDDA